MPMRYWIERDQRTTASEAMPSPLPKIVLLKKPTQTVRDAVGELLQREGI
jgi:hypothetical protein